MKLKLHTISPVHIGSGKHLEPFEYIIDGNMYYRLDQNKAFLLALEAHSDFPEKYTSWLEETSMRLRKTKDNREQAKIREKFNFKYFCENVLGDTELSQRILKEGYAYKCEMPYGLAGKKQVSEQLKDANNNVYIPGSSIKGALKTIFAWRVFTVMPDEKKKNVLSNIVSSKAFRNFKGRNLDELLIQELFICGKKVIDRKSQREKIDYSDIKFDIFKFIKVSDAEPIDVKMAVFPSNLYLTDKAPQKQAPAVEAIVFNSVFEFTIDINEEEIRNIYEISMENNAKSWIGFDKKFKRLFGFYPHEVDYGELEERIVDSIKTTVADFFTALLKREKTWLRNFKDTVLDQRNNPTKNADIESIEEFFDVYKEITTMFKLGWASGFIATTIFDALESNKATKPYLEKIFSQFKIGVPPQKKKSPNVSLPNLSKFPKSRRLVAEKTKLPVDPLGWVALLNEEQNLKIE